MASWKGLSLNPTIRKLHKNKLFLTLLILLFINTLISLKTFATPTKNITVASDVYFTLPYDSEINFGNGQGFNSITSENSTGTWFWVFDSYKFQVVDANLTVTSYFVNNQLGFTLYGDTGSTSTTRIYTASRGIPLAVLVDGVGVPIDYDSGTGIWTLSVVHSSPEVVEVYWDLSSWPPSVLAVWNILPILFLVSMSIYFVREKRKPNLYEIVELSVAFLIIAIIAPVAFNLGWYG